MNGQVHAFEPSLREFVWLSENVQLSTLFNVHLNHFALSNYDGFIEMKIFEEATFGAYNTLGIPSHPAVLGRNIQSQWVRTMKLDTYCHLFGGIVPNLIKIDVEGAELNVLQGAQDLLSQENAPLLIVEACESTLKGFNRTVSELIQYLTTLGYRLFALQPNGDCLPIDQISVGYLNIVAAKPNHISRLQQRGLVRALPYID
jgi:FkbM family methyltransferase